MALAAYLSFFLDNHAFALSLDSVQRVLRMVAVRPLPGAPDAVLGVIDVAGAPVVALNPRRRFGLPERAIALSDQLILARIRRRMVALWTERTGEVFRAPRLDAVRDPSAKVWPGLRSIDGVARLGEDMVYIHDLETFFNARETELVEQALRDAGAA